MINHIILEGRIIKNAELKTAGTSIVTCFTIANNQSYKKNGEWVNKTCFVDCNVWGEYGNIMRQYLNKGQKLTVEGILEQNNWEGSDGKKRNSYRINVKNISIQWEKKENNSNQPNKDFEPINPIPAEEHSMDFPQTDKEEIPF